MKLVSVNVGLPREVEFNGRTISTGIFKSAVEGPVQMEPLNLEGDGQADLKVHGGIHKAVYAYPYEHYATWQDELGRDDFSMGQFGENLTVQGLLEPEVHIGDQFRIGQALVEVTQPREPCFKLGVRMGDPSFIKTFLHSGRVGFYLRVLQSGQIQAGDAIERIHTDPADVSIRDIWHLNYFDQTNVEMMKKVIAIEALSPEWRKPFQKRLDELTEQA